MREKERIDGEVFEEGENSIGWEIDERGEIPQEVDVTAHALYYLHEASLHQDARYRRRDGGRYSEVPTEKPGYREKTLQPVEI